MVSPWGVPGWLVSRPAASLARRLETVAAASAGRAQGHAWPSGRYRADPVAFFREVLGIEPWDRQIEIIEAVRDHDRVSVRSGHKVSKSTSAAGLALWFFCSFDDARVVMSSVTSRQVDAILWRELSMRHARAKVPVGGELSKLARTGLRSTDFREVSGFTAKEAEAVAGISGRHLLYILDEASGIPEIIFEAIEGNRAGGARLVMFSNPTKNSGTFFDSHNARRDFYRAIHISSEESPNVREGREVIPGLATASWVREKRAEWGEDSPLYQVRVRGEFPRVEGRKVVQLHFVTEAEERWEETVAEGRLSLGVDPAALGDDEAGIVTRRGQKVLEVKARRLGGVDLAEEIIQTVRTYRSQHEGSAAVKVDVSGGHAGLGAKFADTLRARAAETAPGELEVFGVDFSPIASDTYPTRRDQLWFGMAAWLRDGGALPPEKLVDGRWCPAHDKKLAAELIAPGFDLDARGRAKVEPKDVIAKVLKRSPDRADALALAIYDTAATQWATGEETPAQQQPHDFYDAASYGINPYAAHDQLMGRR